MYIHRTRPISVAMFNPYCVTALVETDNEQALPVAAFDLLMNVVTSDLAEEGLDPIRYLSSYQEIRGGGDKGLVTNIEELRRRSNRMSGKMGLLQNC